MSHAETSGPDLRSRLRVRIIGRGRAAESFSGALMSRGCNVDPLIGRDRSTIENAAHGADTLMICVTDAAVSEVIKQIEPNDDCVLIHVAGSLTLDVFGSEHVRVGSLHPLVSLPSGSRGAELLTAGAWFATAGDPMVDELARLLGGTAFTIEDSQRAGYHAAACVAANHLVALMGQVDRIAESVGAPREAFMELASGALANVAVLGAADALTGPASRGDIATIERHLAALDPGEHATYRALANEAVRLAGTRAPREGTS